jgi:hypothetical protein
MRREKLVFLLTAGKTSAQKREIAVMKMRFPQKPVIRHSNVTPMLNLQTGKIMIVSLLTLIHSRPHFVHITLWTPFFR